MITHNSAEQLTRFPPIRIKKLFTRNRFDNYIVLGNHGEDNW